MAIEKGFKTGNVLLVSFGHLIHDTYSSFLAPILPLLIDKFSLSYSLAGLLGMLQRLPSLMSPFVGLLADKITMRYLVIFMPAVTAICMSLLGIAPVYPVLAILLFVMGVSSALYHVPSPVMVRTLSGKELGKGMSYYMFGGEIARTLGPLIILGAVSLWGLEGTYRLIPFGVVASLLLYFRLKNIALSPNYGRAESMLGIRETFIHHLPLFMILIGITFFRSVMTTALTTFLPTYLKLKGESLWMGGIFLSILSLSGAAGTLFWGGFSDRIGRKKALHMITFSAPVLMFGFVNIHGWAAIPVLIMLGFVLLGFTPILLALVQDRAIERPAFLNGIFMMISFGDEALAMILTGALGDWIGLETTFQLSGLLALGAIPFVYMIRRQPRGLSSNPEG
jgi:FSR family fosmidomycin resistance protein-like MFS transporter